MNKKTIAVISIFASALAFATSNKILEGDLWKTPDHTKTYTPPAASDTLVGRASTDTLINKMISGSSNTISNLPFSVLTGTALVTQGGTGLSAGTSGGILGFTATGTIASSALLSFNQVVLGGGAGALPVTLSNGTAGQVLTSAGGTSAPTWATPGTGFTNPMTTAGDIIYGGTSGTAMRLGNGTNGQVLTSQGSSSPPAWQAAGTASPLTTKGDVYTYTTVNARHGVPGDNGRMIPDSAQTDGWRNATYSNIQNGRPGKNYVQYADFENAATTGWSLGTTGTLTNGLPTGSPTFGSGASGNLSISIISSGQIAGVDSMSYVSSAATTAGNMVATASLPIDATDQANVLSVNFGYSTVSGTSNINYSGTSSNSFAWAVWDVTNSVWLSSWGNFCTIQSTGVGHCRGAGFQTGATTANIRFVFYNATATGGAATLALDDFYVGPQAPLVGTAISDYHSYTMSITGSSSNPTLGTNTQSARWKQIGNEMEIIANFQQTGAGTAGSGAYLFNLPSGYLIDTTAAKLSTSATGNDGQAVGTGSVGLNLTGGSTQAVTTTYVVPYNTSAVAMYATTGTAQTLNVIGSANFAISNTTAYYSLTFRVPIVGWSSNTALSSDANPQAAVIVAYNSGGSATANTNITGWTTQKDLTGSFNASTGTVTVPSSGDYFAVFTSSTTSGTTYIPSIIYNGSIYGNGTSGATRTIASVLIPNAKANDTINFQLSASLTFGSDAIGTKIQIFRLANNQILLPDVNVAMKYTSSSTTAMTNSTTTFNSTNFTLAQSYDTTNSFTQSSGVYSCTVTGKYRAHFHDLLSFGSTAGTVTSSINFNGTTKATTALSNFSTSLSPIEALDVDTTDICLAGQSISVTEVWNQASGGPTRGGGTAGGFFLEIYREGN